MVDLSDLSLRTASEQPWSPFHPRVVERSSVQGPSQPDWTVYMFASIPFPQSGITDEVV